MDIAFHLTRRDEQQATGCGRPAGRRARIRVDGVARASRNRREFCAIHRLQGKSMKGEWASIPFPGPTR